MASTNTHKQQLKVTGSESSSKSGKTADYSRELEQAETQLARLQQKREAIEQKRQLAEEQSERQQIFIDGQIELIERLDLAVQTIDRELFDARQQQQDLGEARKTFAKHSQVLQAIDPKKWKKTRLSEELENAFGILDQCEDDFEELGSQISQGRSRRFLATGTSPSEVNFQTYFLQGFAFSLPLILLGIVAILIFAFR